VFSLIGLMLHIDPFSGGGGISISFSMGIFISSMEFSETHENGVDRMVFQSLVFNSQ
jgi:hypothetical protein